MRLIQLVSNAVLTASTRNFLVSSLIAPAALVAIGVVSLASAQDLSRQSAAEAAFLKENDAAMTKMMNDMAVKPTDDVDRDFVAVMAPHHQGAIDMAQAELRYGRPQRAASPCRPGHRCRAASRDRGNARGAR